MNKHWMKVFIGALFEVIWVTGLKHAGHVWEWSVTAAAIGLSFWFLIEAGHHLPAGTVYAVFTGLGTAGTVAVEMLVYGEPFHAGKWILIFVVLAGIIGLRMVTPDQDQGKDAGKEQTNEQTG